MLGAAASGIGDVGLVLATLVIDGDPQSWFDNWTAVATDLAARGDEALGRGHLATGAIWAMRKTYGYLSHLGGAAVARAVTIRR